MDLGSEDLSTCVTGTGGPLLGGGRCAPACLVLCHIASVAYHHTHTHSDS